MAEKIPNDDTTNGINPVAAILAAIAVACAMVAITTVNFVRSSAYTTVKQIQIGIKASESMNHGELDITSPINAIDIDEYSDNINQRLGIIDDKSDFGPEAVSDASLGL